MPKAAYYLTHPQRRTTSVVFASPHSGRDYPWSFLRRTALNEHSVRSSEDAFVDQLFESAPRHGAPLIRAGAPRVPNTGARDDLLYLSCLPWVDFTGLTNAMPDAQDCIPRLSWGKFVTGENGHITCAFTAEVHHAIADGAHLGQAVAAIQDRLDNV